MSSFASLLLWSCLWPTFGGSDLPRISGVEQGTLQAASEANQPIQCSERHAPILRWVRPAERFDCLCSCDPGDQAIEVETDSDDDWFVLASGLMDVLFTSPASIAIEFSDRFVTFPSTRGHFVLRC